ncbi:AraC family transcriptional regulator [Neobacillus drentensis]|uniref:AraC family transcriptional regulator n=1 Tax=Neobacillus drentensis TaxID=220684 RepID=UPI001F1881DF|nr:AraC family transcriptional regulator [Neobacillus drentensis]ULT56126.1 AraC family transcriptional regulator [Neobacillus drentensis]
MTTIDYAGTDAVHSSNFVFDIPKGHDCWLLVVTKTPAIIWVNGELKEYPAHSAILYQPHQKIYYRACVEKYMNDWIRFDTNEPYVTETMLPRGVPFSLADPEYCHKLFQLLVTEDSFNNDFRGSSIDYLLRILFNKLLESYFQTGISPQYYNLINLRTEIYTSPGDNWTIPKMSEYVHLSPGYLQTLYKNTFRISCIDDVIISRIRLAKEYLMHGSYTVAEVAFRCGYNNVEHFCRQFKQKTGLTPGRFRNNATSSNSEKESII